MSANVSQSFEPDMKPGLGQTPPPPLGAQAFSSSSSIPAAGILTPLIVMGLDRTNKQQRSLDPTVLVEAIAQRLRLFADEHDFLIDIITQLQPDELGVLISCVGERPDLEQLTQSLLTIMNRPFNVQEHSVHITPSIGVALYPTDTNDINQLQIQARQALNLAREQGGNCCVFYAEETMHLSVENELLSSCLDWILERGDFQTYYQPQFDLKTGALIGAEALIRWRHPKWGILSPGKFIEIAEETGSIVSLGKWVLKQACQQAKHWQSLASDPFKVSVNLSARQLDDPNLCQSISEILSESGLAAHHLELELTESALMQNIDSALLVMQKLKTLGVSLAIDDFGVGYSSLKYLQTLAFDTIKIDRSFISRLDKDPVNASITNAVINLAHDLQLNVVGEGVETPAEHEFLVRHNCDVAQGYFFGRPMPPEHFIDFFQ